MKLTTVFAACLLASGYANATYEFDTWSVSDSKDKMTGEVDSYIASSDWYESKNPMSPNPIAKMYSWVGVNCDKSSQWAYIGFSTKPYMGTASVIERKIVTRVKFDDDLSEITLFTTNDRGKGVYVENANSLIKKISSSKKMLLEFPWYQYGYIYLEYDLAGGKSAIEHILSKCKSL